MVGTKQPDWDNALGRARENAPFLVRALDRQPELTELLQKGAGEAALAWSRKAGDEAELGVALRRERLALATTLAIGDLAGAFPLDRVMSELSAFADGALDRAIVGAISARTGHDKAEGFIALALGKQGASELNYSSDIDPIFLYDPDSLPRRAGDDPGETAQRYARRVVKLLSENTGEGYVQRVDLRLRPASEISPLAVPQDSALSHYQGQALAWERAAFVRARAAAGDVAAGEAFLSAIHPFVWRTALDFGAIEEIRELTRRIRESYGGPIRPGPGFDVKRGRGGIREIEFFAQTHQLIHGGRDPSLRVRGTRAALDALADAGRIDPEHAKVLGESYDRLRIIEHRLQMVGDRQTHSLPAGQKLEEIARLDGMTDARSLVDELTEISERAGHIYENLIGASQKTHVEMPEASVFAIQLKQLGFKKPATLAKRIEAWRDGRYPSLRSPQALEAFDRLLPALLKAMAESDDPERALLRWESILEKATSAITLFRLLDARPNLLHRLVATLTLTPTLSDELARRPELLDTLLDQRALDLPGSVEEIMRRIEGFAVRDDYEALLDAIRIVTGELRFALGVQLIEGLADPLDIAAALSRTAEAAMQLAVRETARDFGRVHGKIANSELLVLGLGRLGGGALTHASDLDIVFLFTGEFSQRSDGSRPLGATHYYNRLASRVSAALSVPTAQGALYEVDTRLRPQGAQGPLAVSCKAFAKYQSEAAWTWEHMALARARVLVGNDASRAILEPLMDQVLRRSRDPEELRRAVTSMRAQMASHKSPRGELDVKLLRGGLVDFEFLTHFLQLRDGIGLNPDFAVALPLLVEAGKLPERLIEQYDFMVRLLVASRLLAPDGKEPNPAAARSLARACGVETYSDLLLGLKQARQDVGAAWDAILGVRLEIEE